MRIFIRVLSSIACTLFFAAGLFAVDDVHKNVGTSGAQFLKITPGARPAALGDSQVAFADDAHAPVINPAGMGFLFAPEIQAMHGLWIGEMYYDYLGYIHPAKGGSFGAAIQYFGGPKLDKIVDGVRSGDFSVYDSVGNISYARELYEFLAVGITAKSIYSKIDTESASTVAADIGIKLRSPNEMFSFGLVGQHMGGSMVFKNESEPLPTTVRTGFGMKIDLPTHHSLFNLAMQANIPRDNKPYYSFGVEHIGGDMFALRFGYTIEPAKNDLEQIADWRAGIGIKIKNFMFDYAFKPFDVLGNAHLISMGWRFSNLGSRKTSVEAALRADPVIFSPNDDGIKDSTFLIPTVPAAISEINRWSIEIRDNIGTLIKTLSGEDVLPSILSWEGKNEFNAGMENGEYTCFLHVVGEGRVEAQSPKEKIYIDTSIPTVSLALSSAAFSPNGDGVDDTVTFKVDASDIHGIARWQINITNQQGKFIRVIKSSSVLPADVVWEGKDDYYNAIVQNGFYDIQFFAWDNAGNRNSTLINSVDLNSQKEFKEIEVKQEARGLVVNLTSNVLFGSGRAVLQKTSKKALDELVELLKNYPENEVSIEGHSDSIGSDASNLKLSSKRAWTVYSYLVKNGINPKRLKPKGYGETRPIASNKTKEGRDKNRRVEVIILRTKDNEKQGQGSTEEKQ